MREVRVSDDRTEVCLSPAAYRAALALLGWTHEDVAVGVMRLTARPYGPTDLRDYAAGKADLPGWVAGAILAVLLQFVEFTCANGEVGVVVKRKSDDVRAVVASDQRQAVARLEKQTAAVLTNWDRSIDLESRRVR